jgi:hypothetical protein
MIGDEFFETAAVTNQNCIREGIESGLNWGGRLLPFG